MADEPSPPVQVETIPSVAGSISAVASANAPFVYFDGVPNFGYFNGIAHMTLEAIRFSAVEGKVLNDRVAVAHLRMNLPALESLKMAIAGIEDLLKRPEDKELN